MNRWGCRRIHQASSMKLCSLPENLAEFESTQIINAMEKATASPKEEHKGAPH
uniref:Uncharacterized protein n=1 Tax=Arundo donax TaxID=35708 RepID=A0A0A9F6V5_ARUDO